MKQLNGTITLAFLEEDNQQRVIFRVIPLCTREGVIFHSQVAEFPDQGSLRIVPDKREQSTFKERMREMGCLCALHLFSGGKELTKVRQNRNYDPGQGESNQFAIYSDVICEFSDDGVFEVFAEGADASVALSPRVLFRRGQVLYGPLDRGASPDWAALRPFGNDSYLLHTVRLPGGAERSFYWNPEQTVNWRQRRGTLRRGKPYGEEYEPAGEPPVARGPAAADVRAADKTPPPTLPDFRGVERRTPAPAAADMRDTAWQQPVRAAFAAETGPAETKRPVAEPVAAETRTIENRPAALAPVAAERAQSEPAPVPVSPARAVAEPARVAPAGSAMEPALPIGRKLAILDETVSFEEQISRLDQPLSDGANLLAGAGPASAVSQPSGEPADSVRFSGTPLVRAGIKPPLPIRQGNAFQNVVERQIRAAHQETGEYPEDYQPVDNPIENLNAALERAWDAPDTQRQALDSLCGNEVFAQAFLTHLRLRGRETNAVRAAQEQLEDIEAERLGLLMQLDTLKNDEKQARETLRASLPQRKREEIAQLEEQARAMREETERLREILAELSGAAREWTLETLASKGAQLLASDGETVALSPVIGENRTPEALVASIRAVMSRRGFAVNEDIVTELLIHFALNEELTLAGETPSAAELYARSLIEGLGLQDVSAFTNGNARVAVASLLPDDGLRSPTVEVCPPGRAVAAPYGHKIIRLTGRGEAFSREAPLPQIAVPPLRTGGSDAAAAALRPVALESLRALLTEAAPLSPKAEDWFKELQTLLTRQQIGLPEAASRRLRTFIAAASSRLRGGFLAAADAATLAWVAPVLRAGEPNLEALRPAIESLPRTLASLGIR